MQPPAPTRSQLDIIAAPLDAKIFLHGPAGSGKSTAGAERLRRLLSAGIPGDSILLLTPQRTLQERYLEISRSAQAPAGTEVTPATIGGLARRACELFWPLVAEKAGFANPRTVPLFLTLESSQYYMAHIVRPLLDAGYFESVTMDRNRLYSQILDSLNKAAVVGFPYTEIGTRLDSASVGDPGQRRIYADAQECATRFRHFCLAHNVLDFSLQLEIFWGLLWMHPVVHDYLAHTYRHLIYDNVEEDVPRAHDLVRAWMPEFASALMIFDEGAGFRRFLGADIDTGWALGETCRQRASLRESFVMSAGMQRLGKALSTHLGSGDASNAESDLPIGPSDEDGALGILMGRFFPEMLDKVVQEVRNLLSAGRASPVEIVIVAPYLSDALRFAITSRLETADIPWRTHRPSRSLRDEPAAQALVTLAAVAHPQWNIRPVSFDVTRALMVALGTDLVRAQLLSKIAYRAKEFALAPFEGINADMQERITFLLGSRFSELRAWLLAYREQAVQPLDHFLKRLFGEVLSQPGFGFHENLDGARVASSLVESVRKFRLAMQPPFGGQSDRDLELGREYVSVLSDGVLAAQYLESWAAGNSESVLVAPAYSFLMMNEPASFEFWLDPGSSGWFQRLDQPLTHTQVLSRGWADGRQWTFADEEQANLTNMARLVMGLVRRCRRKIYLCISNLGESGFEPRGRLLTVFQRILYAKRPA